ncbi:MAG: hypothetical protein COB38_07785 [Gammaproteobacteria bacterium]|nr:MAG: hypothetical protein COB38_07785 [Gammaproteobacteria bacterium]
MKILKVGDTTKAACNSCKSFQDVTFQLRDTPFNDGSGIVKNVLVGVCNACDSVVVLPHQSTPVVKKQLEKQRKSLESRVPAHMIDILNLASDKLGGGTEFVSNIMKYYIHALSNNKISSNNISRFLKSDLATGVAQKRISLKGRYLEEEVILLKEMIEVESTTDLLKIVVLKINDDLLVNERQKPIGQLKNIMAATV